VAASDFCGTTLFRRKYLWATRASCYWGDHAVFAIAIRKELLIPILCGVFLVENLSVIMQVYYFKYQKHKRGIEYARGHRLFKMAPLHHHYQKSGFTNQKSSCGFLSLELRWRY
jgi:UDP-N-acetylmuramyl pentapeptide phosphotransferase/UDP-N-acetylglucosamine-1-phosphate transferase